MRATRMTAVLGAGLFLAGAVFAAAMPAGKADGKAGPLQVVINGTVHQALFAVDFDGDLGVTVGAGGEIQESTDKGTTWKLVEPAPAELALLGVGVSGKRALAVGQSGLMLARSEDGKWSKVESGSTARLFSVKLNAKGQAVVAGAFGTVLVSDDGGQQWRAIVMDWSQYAADGMEPHLYAASISEDGVMTIAGEFGLILRSADGGANWKVLNKGDASLFGLQLRADGVGYAVGQSGTILRSTNNGDTWTTLTSGSEALLLSVNSESDGRVVVTAMRDMLYSRDNGDSWKQVPAPEITNAWYAGIDQAGPGTAVLAVGQSGQIVRLDP